MNRAIYCRCDNYYFLTKINLNIGINTEPFFHQFLKVRALPVLFLHNHVEFVLSESSNGGSIIQYLRNNITRRFIFLQLYNDKIAFVVYSKQIKLFSPIKLHFGAEKKKVGA